MWFRLIIIFGIIGLAEYYSYILVRSSVRNLPAVWKNTITVFYLLLTLLSWSGIVFFRFINRAAIPHMVFNVYVTFVLGFFIGKLLATTVMLADDVRRLFTWFFSTITASKSISPEMAKPIERSEFLKNTAIVLAGISILGISYGLRNRYNYQVRRIKLSFDELPDAFKGIRIVQVSDIHTGSFDNHDAVERGILKIMELKPDLILFTGDLVNNLSAEVDARYKAIFSKLSAPLGVYSTLGNHDYGDYVTWDSKEEKQKNLQQLIDTHAAMGWRLLMNEHVMLKRGNDSIALIGVENWSNRAHFPKHGDLQKAYAGIDDAKVPFKILMSHDPSHWNGQVIPYYPGVQLTLSGHTHGMQFGIETKWLKWSPVQYMYKQWAGLYQEGNQYLYVNRGFGFIGYPGRLGILPEITLFELV